MFGVHVYICLSHLVLFLLLNFEIGINEVILVSDSLLIKISFAVVVA